MPVLSLACHLPHNAPHIAWRYNYEQTTKQTKAINNSYIYINISCKCDTNRAGHLTLDAYASRPVACVHRHAFLFLQHREHIQVYPESKRLINSDICKCGMLFQLSHNPDLLVSFHCYSVWSRGYRRRILFDIEVVLIFVYPCLFINVIISLLHMWQMKYFPSFFIWRLVLWWNTMLIWPAW